MPDTDKSPKTFFVHDWVDETGGAERVLLLLDEIFRPQKIFTMLAHPAAELTQRLGGRIKTSWLQRWPLAFRLHRYLLPLYPEIIESFDVTEADIVLSSSHCVAKGVLSRSDQLHLCYIHTPARYLWDLSHEYLRLNRVQGIKKMFTEHIFHKLRIWDVTSSSRVSLFIANSSTVARRVWGAYRRPSLVIHPGVDLRNFKYSPDVQKKDYFVVISRLVSQKRIDLAVAACARLDVPLKVVGDGPEFKRLRKMSGPRTEFCGFLKDSELVQVVEQAQALLFPCEEDLGLTPIESQALGIPVLAYRRGGALDTVTEGETGSFFEDQSVENLVEAIRKFRSADFDPLLCVQNARRFSTEVFKLKMSEVFERAWAYHQAHQIFRDEDFIRSLPARFEAKVVRGGVGL